MAALRIAVVVGAALLWATPAQATSIVVEDDSPDYPYQRWANRAEVPTPETTLTVIETRREGSSTAAGTHTIWFGLTPAWSARHTFLHELGHNFDYYSLADQGRDHIREILGTDQPWRDESVPPYESPHEMFAEVYAACAMRWRARRPPHLRFRPSTLLSGVGRIRHREMCRVIRHQLAPPV